MADNFSALRSPREEPSLFDQVRTASQPTPETQYELTNGSEGQLMKGLRTGAAGLSAGSFANQALSEEVAGNPDFEHARDLALQTQQQGAMYAPRVSSLRDIHSIGDAADYAAGSFGQGAVSMAPTLATALLTGGRGKLGQLTGFLGSAGSAYNLERGEAALGQYADPTLSKASAHDRDLAATTKGAINAGLESIVPASLASSVLRRPTQSFLGHVGREALTEGLTETAQQGVGFGAEKYLDPNRTLDPVDLADAFVGGALTGGGVSAGALAPTHIAHAAEQHDNAVQLPASEPSPPTSDAVPPQTAPPAPDAGSPSYVSDMIDRFKSAAAETSSPVDFVKHVFGGGTAGQAEADLVPDHEDPGVLSAPDPEAALVARDAARAERAATYAKELMESDTTPINVKEAIQAMGGDFSDQNNQRYVTGTYAAQKVGEKVGSAVNDFVKLSKDLVGGIQDRVSKKNLQEIEDADITPLVSLLAQRMGPANAPDAPKIARQLVAAANRISPDATISEATDRRLRALSSAVSDEVLDMVTDLSGSDGLRNAITKLRKIPSAQNDVQKSNGGSFLESMLKVPLGKTALNNLSQFVDEFGLQLKDVSKERRAQVLTALSAAFGSKREAQVVVEYYGNLKRAAHEKMAEADKTRSDDFDQAAGLLSEEDRANLTEKDAAPESTYQFADAKALRPYRTFVGQMKSGDGMRRRLRESTIAGAQLRNAGADVSPVKMSQYVTETGGDHEAEVKRLAADIKDRIAEHEGRKGEDRSQQINELKGELDLLRHNYKEGGAQQALDLYEVLKVGNKEKNDTIATDEDIAKYSHLADQGDARNTRVTFEREDGTKFTLSAESMWKTQGTKEGSGKGENARARAKRLFADAAAAVLARPEVTKMVTAPEKITIDRGLDLRAKKTGSPEYRRKVAAALEAAGNDIKGLKSELDGMVDRYLDMKPDDPERAAIEEALMDGSIVSSLEDHGTADENVARAVTREKQRLYREAQGQIDAIKFDEDFDERDNNRKGVPGGEEEGELGPNKLPRTRANEELENPGTRRYEEDTGLAIGAEKRGSTLSVPEQEIYDRHVGKSDKRVRKNSFVGAFADPEGAAKAEKALGAGTSADGKQAESISPKMIDALYDVAVKENYARLDTPEKVLAYVQAAKDMLQKLRAKGEENLAEGKEDHLYYKLLQDFKQSGSSAFDWDMLFDGLNPTTAQRAQLRDIVAKQSAVGPTDQEGPVNLRAIQAEVLRTRGKNVKVRMNRLFSELGASGEFTMDDDKTNRVIEIAINASNPMGVAWHESLHDFFAMLDETPAQRSIKRDLIAAADAPQVKKRLRELLAAHPEALKQVESSPEERVAYMYQFWAADELKLGPTGQGIFDKLRRFFEDLFKIVGADTRAGALLEALHKGKFADPSTVSEVLADLPAKRFQNKMEEIAPELSGALTKIFKTAPDRLREFHNDKLTELADRFSSERGKAGFIQNRFQQQGIWENRLAKIFEGTNAEQRRRIMTKALAMEDQDTPVGQALTSLFADMHNYMVQAGVKTLDQTTNKWVPLRKVEKFFPRIWNPDAIARNRSEFMQLLVQHGGLSTSAAATAADNLIDGREKRPPNENMELGFLPFAATTNERIFKFIDPANASAFAKFQNNDLADVTTQYIKQAVHRAEYAREFGNNGEEIAKLINKSGVTDPAELKNISNTVQALEGSLDPGHWSRSTKEIMSSVLTLQNITLLPLAIASQMVDPIVLAARSGKVQDAGKAFVTAIKRLAGKKADGEDLAKMLGMITQESVLEAMGNAYGATHMSKRMHDINRVFFKYNGMQGWNNSMRIAATAAGERYLIAKKNDTKALEELGLEPSDIKVDKDGRLDVSNDKVKQAMFRFVDQAVLRPSASHRPVWMSDPRFLLIAHLKQFTFAMQNVVLKRANRELDEGNPKPWAILALTMPVVLAADMAKFALTGTMPSSWGFKDYFSHAVSRSGLMGLGDFGTQATRGMQQGALPGESLLGPSIENLIKILRWGGGDPRISGSDVIDRTVPFAKFI